MTGGLRALYRIMELPGTNSLKEARAALDAAVSSSARHRADRNMVAKLAAALPLDRVVLPRLFASRIGPAELETLADALDAC